MDLKPYLKNRIETLTKKHDEVEAHLIAIKASIGESIRTLAVVTDLENQAEARCQPEKPKDIEKTFGLTPGYLDQPHLRSVPNVTVAPPGPPPMHDVGKRCTDCGDLLQDSGFDGQPLLYCKMCKSYMSPMELERKKADAAAKGK